jgi:transposase
MLKPCKKRQSSKPSTIQTDGLNLDKKDLLKNIKTEAGSIEAKSEHNSKRRTKIEDIHIECIKKYLLDNNTIGATEIKTRLLKDTGLSISKTTIYSILERLRKELNPNTPLAKSSFQTGSKKLSGRPSKLHINHYECLKKYLIEDSSIGNTEARDKLFKETGLSVTTPTIRTALLKLEKEILESGIKLASKNSSSKIRNKKGSYGFKLNDSHVACLQEYLKENYYIGSREATLRIKCQMNLDVSIPTVWKVLKELREDMEIEHDTISPPYSLKVTKRNDNLRDIAAKKAVLSSNHLELLKEYYIENNYIGLKEAQDRLKLETGLNSSITPIRDALMRIKRESSAEGIETHLYTTKCETRQKNTKYGLKLKDSHLNLLKGYLIDDIDIAYKDAQVKLFEDAGLNLGYSTIIKTLKQLKNELSSDEVEQLEMKSDSKLSRMIGYKGYKLKEMHVEYLSTYINEDGRISYGARELRDMLYRDTGVSVNHRTVWTILGKLLELR